MPISNSTFLQDSSNDGPVTAVFLHHFGGSRTTWTEVLQRLEAMEPALKCLSFDQRGFSDSTLDATGCTIEDYADDVVQYLTANNIKRCLLIGHSMGGKFALAVASRRLSNIAGLLLVAPSPPTPEPMSDQDREELRRANGSAEVAAVVVSKGAASKLSTAVFARTVDDIQRSSAAAWGAWLNHGSRVNISNSMQNVNIPVTVLAGGRDPGMTPCLLEREVIDRIAGSRLIVIPDAGHLMPLDSPAAISAYVREMVAALQSDSPTTLRTAYPPNTVREALQSDRVTEPTRNVLLQRLEVAPIERASFFDAHCFALLHAVCDRLIPQTAGYRIDIAGRIDTRLALVDGNGWRYEVLPVDGEAYRQALSGIEELSRDSQGCGFLELAPEAQDQILFSIRHGLVGGGIWDRLSPKLFFEELLAEASEIYFSSPVAQEKIGYVGMADRKGWSNIALNQLDSHEPRALESSLA